MAKPNIIWDAICDLWAMKPVTKSDNTRMGKLFRDFTLKGATPEELALRKRRYEKEWHGVACTPEAVLKHWDRFAASKAVEPLPVGEWPQGSSQEPIKAAPGPTSPETMFARLPVDERAGWIAQARQEHPDVAAPVAVNEAVKLWQAKEKR